MFFRRPWAHCVLRLIGSLTVGQAYSSDPDRCRCQCGCKKKGAEVKGLYVERFGRSCARRAQKNVNHKNRDRLFSFMGLAFFSVAIGLRIQTIQLFYLESTSLSVPALG